MYANGKKGVWWKKHSCVIRDMVWNSNVKTRCHTTERQNMFLCLLNTLAKLMRFDLILLSMTDLSFELLCVPVKKNESFCTVFPLQISHLVKTVWQILMLFVVCGGFCSSHEVYFIIVIQNLCGKQNVYQNIKCIHASPTSVATTSWVGSLFGSHSCLWGQPAEPLAQQSHQTTIKPIWRQWKQI